MNFTIAVALFAAFATVAATCVNSYFQYKTNKENNFSMLEKIRLEQEFNLELKSLELFCNEKISAYKDVCNHNLYLGLKNTYGDIFRFFDSYNRAYKFADNESRQILNELYEYVINNRPYNFSDTKLQEILNNLAVSLSNDLERYKAKLER